jgi:hypothetical protein
MDIEKTYSTHEIEKPIGSLSLVRNRHGRETIHYLLSTTQAIYMIVVNIIHYFFFCVRRCCRFPLIPAMYS